MKKIFKYSVFMILVLIFCSACDGDVTRELRHSGFNVGNEFVCDAFYPKNKDDLNYQKIKYFTGSHIITEQGKIYEVSMQQQYANKSNCKVADTSIEVIAIFDNKIVKAKDGKFYYLFADSATTPYSEVTSSDNSYQVYDLLLKPESTIKVITADSSSGLYYVLKNDGNVYSYTLSSSDRNSPLSITSTNLVYNKADYGSENLVDFNYVGDNGATFVRSDTRAFKMNATNAEECQKYVDVACKFQMEEFTAYSKYKDSIIAYNGSTIITKYKLIFTIGY